MNQSVYARVRESTRVAKPVGLCKRAVNVNMCMYMWNELCARGSLYMAFALLCDA